MEELITGRDGQVRGAIVKVNSGQKPTALRRPLQRLYPLEVGCQTDDNRQNETQNASDMPKTVSTSQYENVDSHIDEVTETTAAKCSTRVAAIKARGKVKAWTVYKNES